MRRLYAVPPADAAAVDTLDLNTSGSQLYRDGWAGELRTCVYLGRCVACGRRCYVFEDGRNDPRGPLGDAAGSPLCAPDYDMAGPDVTACFSCMNEERSYRAAVSVARARWRPRGSGPGRSA